MPTQPFAEQLPQVVVLPHVVALDLAVRYYRRPAPLAHLLGGSLLRPLLADGAARARAAGVAHDLRNVSSMIGAGSTIDESTKIDARAADAALAERHDRPVAILVSPICGHALAVARGLSNVWQPSFSLLKKTR